MDFAPRFFRLALVNVASNLLVPVAGLIDTAFLGHLSEIRHLAGVALATVLFDYLYWTFGFLRMATTGLTAQAVGRGDRLGAAEIGLRNALLGFGLGLGLIALQVPIGAAGFALLRAEPGVLTAGQAFFAAMIWGAPATLVNFALVGWFLGREQAGRVLVLTGAAAAVNIALDYLFVVRWGWQSAGAGWATAASQYLMLAVGLGFALSEWRRTPVPLVRLFSLTALRAGFALNRDIVIRTLALVTVFAAFTNLGAALGTRTLAVNALMLEVLTVGAYFVDGLAFATESLAGFFKGSGDSSRLGALLVLAGGTCVAVGLAFAGAFALAPGVLFGLLTDHRDVLARVATFAPWLVPVLGIGALAYMLDGYFLGLSAGRTLRNAALLAAGLGFVPVACLAWATRSDQVLWLALATFMLARVVSLLVRVPDTLAPAQTHGPSSIG